MGKIVLFSPVGNTDPISTNNYYDGALIHTCRIYKPDDVILYMSKEIMDNEANDNRYTYCLEKLYELLGKQLSFSIIERPDLIEVHDFNYFYDDFRRVLKDILSKMNKDDELILNTSSGTPAMKSALVVLVTVGDISAKLVQVSTPEKKSNFGTKEYDVKTHWDMYVENTIDFVNRSNEISCHSLAQIKNEEMVKQLIRSYDYSAALAITKMMNEEYTSRYIHYLEYACYRLRLDFVSLSKIESEYGLSSMLPVCNSMYRNAIEYSLALFVKKKREEYGDFVRAITPLILELFILILEKKTKVNARHYCRRDSDTSGYRWDLSKLQGGTETKKWVDILNTKFPGGFDANKYLGSIELLYIIKEVCNEDVFNKAQELRTVEERVRNGAAHEIRLVNSETVALLTGFSCDHIINTIKSLFNYVGIGTNEDVWNSYEHMNNVIISNIGYPGSFDNTNC